MNDIRELMLKSLDGQLSQKEKNDLKVGLEGSEKLQKEMHDYELLRESLANTDFSFGKGFSDRIMQKLEKPQLDLFGSFKNIAISSAAAIALLLISVYFMDGSIDLDALYGIHGYSVEEEFYSFLNL